MPTSKHILRSPNSDQYSRPYYFTGLFPLPPILCVKHLITRANTRDAEAEELLRELEDTLWDQSFGITLPAMLGLASEDSWTSLYVEQFTIANTPEGVCVELLGVRDEKDAKANLRPRTFRAGISDLRIARYSESCGWVPAQALRRSPETLAQEDAVLQKIIAYCQPEIDAGKLAAPELARLMSRLLAASPSRQSTAVGRDPGPV